MAKTYDFTTPSQVFYDDNNLRRPQNFKKKKTLYAYWLMYLWVGGNIDL